MCEYLPAPAFGDTPNRLQCLGGPLDGCRVSFRGRVWLIHSGVATGYRGLPGDHYESRTGLDGRRFYLWTDGKDMPAAVSLGYPGGSAA